MLARPTNANNKGLTRMIRKVCGIICHIFNFIFLLLLLLLGDSSRTHLLAPCPQSNGEEGHSEELGDNERGDRGRGGGYFRCGCNLEVVTQKRREKPLKETFSWRCSVTKQFSFLSEVSSGGSASESILQQPRYIQDLPPSTSHGAHRSKPYFAFEKIIFTSFGSNLCF